MKPRWTRLRGSSPPLPSHRCLILRKASQFDSDWNRMLYELVSILNKHGETAQGSLELMIDHNGELAYSTKSEAARKRFLRDLYGK